MKKVLLVLSVFLLVGCGGESEADKAASQLILLENQLSSLGCTFTRSTTPGRYSWRESTIHLEWNCGSSSSTPTETLKDIQAILDTMTKRQKALKAYYETYTSMSDRDTRWDGDESRVQASKADMARQVAQKIEEKRAVVEKEVSARETYLKAKVTEFHTVVQRTKEQESAQESLIAELEKAGLNYNEGAFVLRPDVEFNDELIRKLEVYASRSEELFKGQTLDSWLNPMRAKLGQDIAKWDLSAMERELVAFEKSGSKGLDENSAEFAKLKKSFIRDVEYRNLLFIAANDEKLAELTESVADLEDNGFRTFVLPGSRVAVWNTAVLADKAADKIETEDLKRLLKAYLAQLDAMPKWKHVRYDHSGVTRVDSEKDLLRKTLAELTEKSYTLAELRKNWTALSLAQLQPSHKAASGEIAKGIGSDVDLAVGYWAIVLIENLLLEPMQEDHRMEADLLKRELDRAEALFRRLDSGEKLESYKKALIDSWKKPQPMPRIPRPLNAEFLTLSLPTIAPKI